MRRAFYAVDREEQRKGRDILWFIWSSPGSPLFGKDKMATFERYFLAEKETHKEKKNPYYSLLEDEEVIDNIMKEFGFGAEIGISTQKLHARGPMGLRELTTNKYIIYGEGQIR